MLSVEPDSPQTITVNVLVANIGSTSFKYKLLGVPDGTVHAQGRIERIGQPGAACPDYAAAIEKCVGDIGGVANLDAIGFKAVHAGPVSGARLVDDLVLNAMEDFAFFAPAHNPPYIAAMRSFRDAVPHIPLVALFETAFFDRLTPAATAYAIPQDWRDELGIRRYGFHGASHRAASERAAALLGRTRLRHISCHLGGSSSLAAIRDGVAIDTSFGISPQSGLPHNNRTGDLDVFAALYVMKKRALGPDEMARILSTESGLAGISGTTGDMRDLEEGIARGDGRCRLAVEVFVKAIRRYLGAFLVELGGVDVLTFSGGIGENSPAIRAAVCAGLEPFGLILDPFRNETAGGREGPLHAAPSQAAILIVPADEERIVARAAAEVVANA